MSRMRIGLVTEGTTDQVVIQHILTTHFQIVSPQKGLEIINLQPVRDATSGHAHGGWTQVYKWCERNRSITIDSQGLFDEGLDAFAVDFIIIQLDSDVLEEVWKFSFGEYLPSSCKKPAARGRYTRRAIAKWLSDQNSTLNRQFVPLATVEAIEAWLIAAVRGQPNAEETKDLEKELEKIEEQFSTSLANTRKGRRRKITKKYESFCARFIVDTKNVYENCFQFRRLIRVISK